MDTWDVIKNNLKSHRDDFLRSYKCIYRNSHVTADTVRKHLRILVNSLDNLRKSIIKYKCKLTDEHFKEANIIYWETRDKLLKVYVKYNIHVEVPHNLTDPIILDTDRLFSSDNKDTLQTIPEEVDIEYNPDSNILLSEMPQTPIDFLNIVSKLMPEFNGRP